MIVYLRFYEELNDFLPRARRKKEFTREIPETTSVKDLIEGCGVPHTEVDLILVNGESVDFSRKVRDGDRVSVYPVFESLDISGAIRLQQRPLRNPRLLADVNLGKLARYLRMAGLDTAYRNDATDPELIEQMQREDRALLTRDRRLLMHAAVEKGYLVRSDQPTEQLEEVVHRFDLYSVLDPFSRCIHCNHKLNQVEKDAIRERLLPLTERYVDEFAQCPHCHKVYWSGSHRRRLDRKVKELLGVD